MTTLEVKLLGHFSITFDGIPLTTLYAPRLQELFAYLLINRSDPISRYQAASLFWPDSSDDQALTNLRNLIYQLRRALPESDRFIHADAHFLEWRKDIPFTFDVAEFEHCLEPQPGNGMQRESFDRAVQIYHGDLFPDCYADWILPERERLRQAYLHALEALSIMAEDSREYVAALSYTRLLIQSDPLIQSANYQLVRLYSLLGDRPAALKAYQVYSRLLREELGVEPGAEMQDLFESIRQASMTAADPTIRHLAPLVGRRAEWRQLRSTWHNSSQGSSQILFLSGDAGIGKTRLVQELTHWATMQGIQTATAFCYPAEGSLPYSPVVSWLRAQPLPPLDKIWLVEIARLLPEILQSNPHLPKLEPLNEDWQRQRLFETLARALLTKRQRMILILEDIHWCDQDTLEWLHFFLRFGSKAPLLVVATIRSGEIQPDHPLVTLQTALRSEGRYAELVLTPLSESETLTLIGQTAQETSGQSLDPDIASQIYSESEGNPLFAIELVRLGQAYQNEKRAGGQSILDSDRAQAALVRRIQQLNPRTWEITCLAAVIGREFNLDVLHHASADSDENIVMAIDEMLQRRIIREISADTYDFTHDKLRVAAFGGTSTAHQRLLHRKVAEAYQELDESSLHPRNAEIASHYERAGLLLQAIHYYRLAGESAAHIFANADAQNHFQHAIELAITLGFGEPNGISTCDYAFLLERYGDLMALNGKYLQAQTAFEQALAQLFSCPGLLRSQLYRKISTVLRAQYRYQQACEALDQAEQALQLPEGGETIAERQEWIQIQLDRGELNYWDHHPDQIDVIVQKISPLTELEGSVEQQAELLSIQYQARLLRERFWLSEETVELVRRRLKIAETGDDPYEVAWAQFQMGFALIWHREPDAALEWLAKSYDAAAHMGARLLQVRSLAYQCMASRKLGNIESFSSKTEELLELAPAIGEQIYEGVGLTNRGWLAWRNGDYQSAIKDCRSALDLWSKLPGGYPYALADWILLSIAVSMGQLETAKSSAEALLNPSNPLLAEPLSFFIQKALIACQAKEEDTAFRLFTQALEQAQAFEEL